MSKGTLKKKRKEKEKNNNKQEADKFAVFNEIKMTHEQRHSNW